MFHRTPFPFRVKGSFGETGAERQRHYQEEEMDNVSFLRGNVSRPRAYFTLCLGCSGLPFEEARPIKSACSTRFSIKVFFLFGQPSCEAKALLRVLDLWLSQGSTPQDPRPQLLELKIRSLGLEMAGQRARRHFSVFADVYMISLRAVCLLSRERRARHKCKTQNYDIRSTRFECFCIAFEI